MKLRIFTIIIALANVFSSYSMKEINYSYDPKGLLIFLDDSEHDELRAVSSSLIIALNQNAGPIIVSKSLLVNVFPRYERLERDTPQEMFARYIKVSSGVNKGDKSALKEQKYIFLKALAFDATKWLFKKINDSLYLLIPHDYLKRNNISIQDAKKYDSKAKLSITELQLGLKINHMPTVDFYEIKGPIKEYIHADYFMEALYNKTKKTSSIFCTRAEYKGWDKPLPAWSLYIEGHGIIKQTIIGLSLQQFKKMLNFLENNINTKLLVYRSCYAAGLNHEIIFKDAKSAIYKTYSFAIVTQALTDSVTYALIQLQLADNLLSILSYESFAQFLTAVTTREVMNFPQIISTIFPFTPLASIPEKQRWGNVPQIKLPGIEWFSVLASDKDIVSIGSILAKTRDASTPLAIVNFFKTDPKALLLYASDIPFELIINGDNLEAIISMIPGDATHIIRKIVSSKKNIYELLHMFMAVKKLSPEKIFFIYAMNDIHNVLIYNKEVPGIPVPRSENHAIFEKEGVLYLFELGKEIAVLDNKVLERHYLQLRAQLQGKPFELGSLIFAKKSDISFPTLLGSTIIKEIEGKQNTLSNILYGIKFRLPDHALLWVDKITAQYDDVYTNIANIPRRKVITIYDVVIDKDTNEIFYRYNSSFYKGKQKIDYDYRDEYKDRINMPTKRTDVGVTQEQVEAIKKAIQQKIKKGSLQKQIKQKEQQEIILQQSLAELRQKLLKLENILRA